MIIEELKDRFVDLVNELKAKEPKLKLKFLAKEIGITYETFSKIYTYGIVPKPITLCRIGDFFNRSVTFLLAQTDSEYFDKAKNPKTFLERMEELRKSENLTYYGLAQVVHAHKNYVAAWRDKNYIPSLGILENMADHFNVSLDYLLGRTDDDTPYKDLEEN